MRRQRPCHAVSIGIGEDWFFEKWLAREIGCRVDAFDPTIRLAQKHKAYAATAAKRGQSIHFHFAGLGAHRNNSMCKIKDVGYVPCHEFAKVRERHQLEFAKTRERHLAARLRGKDHGKEGQGRRLAVRTWFQYYGTIAGDRLWPLDTLLRMGDAGERIDVLKIDCEGCEWDAFSDLMRRRPRLLARVDQIVLELHLRVQFHLESMDQLDRLFRHLFLDHGFRVFRAEPSAGVHKALSHTQPPRDLAASGFETDRWLAVELSLVRPGCAGGRHSTIDRV